jgi:hypothetical protein
VRVLRSWVSGIKIREAILDNNADYPRELPIPSLALKDFKYVWKQRAWVYTKRPDVILPEFTPPRPSAEDPESMQAWLTGDWLKRQGVYAIGSVVFSADDVTELFK